MDTIKSKARRAGLLYLLILLNAPINNLYIPSAFIVPGNATATAQKIAAAELAYRFGIVSGLLGQILFVFLVLSLYDLLKEVHRRSARLMVMLVLAGVAVALANLVNQMAPLLLLRGADYLSVFPKSQLDALALTFLRLRNAGENIAMAFWALWLFPLGVLVIKSKFFPKILGVLLIIGCFAYLTLSFTSIVFPAYRSVVDHFAMPFYAIGELSLILWLLIKGAKEPPQDTMLTASR